VSASFPFPDLDWEPTRGFWSAAARGELAIPRCAACATWVWYPSERCPGCGGASMPWTRASGRGTLFSFAVVRRAWVAPFDGLAPYATGLVALEEDPSVRLVTLLVDCEPEELAVDMPLRAVFRPLPFSAAPREVIAPLFAPAR
jgi:uncharacterized OB-fold protein